MAAWRAAAEDSTVLVDDDVSEVTLYVLMRCEDTDTRLAILSTFLPVLPQAGALWQYKLGTAAIMTIASLAQADPSSAHHLSVSTLLSHIEPILAPQPKVSDEDIDAQALLAYRQSVRQVVQAQEWNEPDWNKIKLLTPLEATLLSTSLHKRRKLVEQVRAHAPSDLKAAVNDQLAGDQKCGDLVTIPLLQYAGRIMSGPPSRDIVHDATTIPGHVVTMHLVHACVDVVQRLGRLSWSRLALDGLRKACGLPTTKLDVRDLAVQVGHDALARHAEHLSTQPYAVVNDLSRSKVDVTGYYPYMDRLLQDLAAVASASLHGASYGKRQDCIARVEALLGAFALQSYSDVVDARLLAWCLGQLNEAWPQSSSAASANEITLALSKPLTIPTLVTRVSPKKKKRAECTYAGCLEPTSTWNGLSTILLYLRSLGASNQENLLLSCLLDLTEKAYDTRYPEEPGLPELPQPPTTKKRKASSTSGRRSKRTKQESGVAVKSKNPYEYRYV